MEATNLMALISRLINQSKSTKGAEKISSEDQYATSVIKEYLNISGGTKKSNVIPLSRQLALEQVRYLN